MNWILPDPSFINYRLSRSSSRIIDHDPNSLSILFLHIILAVLLYCFSCGTFPYSFIRVIFQYLATFTT